jgi:cyclohexadieny/prephenate dehydrogenase
MTSSSAHDVHINKLVIVGLGLIGGSVAKALRARQAVKRITACGHRESTLKTGLQLGIIDEYKLDLYEALRGADVVIVAAPTIVAEKLLVDVLQHADATTLVTDVASVKGNLLRAVEKHFGQVPSNYVPGHPIAGSEQSGVTAAKADLFVNHRVILTPTETTDPLMLRRAEMLWQVTGADVVTMSVIEHDTVLASTSHLPHVLAYTLVDALALQPRGEEIFRFAAGGFRDFTRIAASDPTMWHDISLANSEALLPAIDIFAEHLAVLRKAIAEADSKTLMTTFERAKSARERFGVMLAKQQNAASSE